MVPQAMVTLYGLEVLGFRVKGFRFRVQGCCMGLKSWKLLFRVRLLENGKSRKLAFCGGLIGTAV